jgi:poly-gamma-glutamate capsule biosynthesis protein CapA/YwtB (metallophosphatase superfamily)
MKILFAGDFCSRLRLQEKFLDKDFSYVLGEVKHLVSSVDLSLVNFETTIATVDDLPIRKSGPNLKSGEEALDALKWCGFSLLCLANNHFRDYVSNAI